MKNTLALVLMVFGIVGCATSPPQKTSTDFEGWTMSTESIFTTNNIQISQVGTQKKFGFKYDSEKNLSLLKYFPATFINIRY
jgi:hypothetical protein